MVLEGKVFSVVVIPKFLKNCGLVSFFFSFFSEYINVHSQKQEKTTKGTWPKGPKQRLGHKMSVAAEDFTTTQWERGDEENTWECSRVRFSCRSICHMIGT